ncbi:SAM-dependent methyltransferase [Streptomyces sp. NPDC048845]|uniref:SAM-dependent methyltransferase n=1 Tax=Streptomyces sp. NPDC048845 TaxID=3155390 RepID=UPI00343024E2
MTDQGDGEGRRGWRAATERALYGPRGFYLRQRPADHFRTSVHASPLFAGAVAGLLARVDVALGRPDPLALVDVGAGRGELLTAVLGRVPAERAARLRPYAVERAARPDGLDPRIDWRHELPGPEEGLRGLLFANEWLDNVPLDVAETDPDGVPRLVLVHPDGRESPGGPVTGADAEWLQRWWPLGGGAGAGVSSGAGDGAGAGAGRAHGGGRTHGAEGAHGGGGGDAAAAGAGAGAGADGSGGADAGDSRSGGGIGGVGVGGGVDGGVGGGGGGGDSGSGGDSGIGSLGGAAAAGARAEIGWPRDAAWAAAAGVLDSGLAVAVDYAHTLAGRPPLGTLTGFRDGREVPPVPDGSCDITAHVALDACAEAGRAAVAARGGGRAAAVTPVPVPAPALLSQREVLRALGVDGGRPPLALATHDPAVYVRALARAGEAAELTDPAGLGAFGWLLQPVGLRLRELGLDERPDDGPGDPPDDGPHDPPDDRPHDAPGVRPEDGSDDGPDGGDDEGPGGGPFG